MHVIYIFDCSFGRLGFLNCSYSPVYKLMFLKSVLIDSHESYTCKPEYGTAVRTNFLLYLPFYLCRFNHCFKPGEFLG